MANPVIGHIKCPHCDNPEATVHREAKGKKKLYYRCYPGGLEEGCGTVQIRYPSGQKWIEANMRPLDQAGTEKAAAEEAKDASREATKAAKKESRSFMSRLLEED